MFIVGDGPKVAGKGARNNTGNFIELLIFAAVLPAGFPHW